MGAAGPASQAASRLLRRGRAPHLPSRALALLLLALPAAASPAPTFVPLQMRFAKDAPPPGTNLVALTLHPPPSLALVTPPAERAVRASELGGWRRDESPAPGTMAVIAPQDPAPAREPGWLTDESDNDTRSDAFGEHGQRRRGWLANSVNRLQIRAAAEALQESSGWDDVLDTEEDSEPDLWSDKPVGTQARSWEPPWNKNGADQSVWADELNRSFGLEAWRDTAVVPSGTGQDHVTRPTYGVPDDER